MEDKSGDNVTMNRKAKILWIDDNPERSERALQLKEDSRMSVEFVCVQQKNVQEELARIRQEYKPRLVVIDHVLNDTRSEEWAKFGSSLVGFFRETWPGCAVFGVTAGRNMGSVDIEKYAYDELIDYTDFSEYGQYLPNVVKGFEKCATVRSVEEWIRLLKGPKGETERIRGSMPRDAKTEFEMQGFPNRVYRWFRKKFYKMPGFLYDRNWVATLVGVKTGVVERYLEQFASAKYRGVFNNPHDPRWWKAKLYEEIYSKCKDENAACMSTQEAGNRVLSVAANERSKCYACNGKWPEVLGYVDASETASLKQMHLRCTIAHAGYRYEAMFDEVRMMGGRTDG